MTAEPDREAFAPITDHVASGLALLTQRWRSRPNVVGFLSPWLARVQEFEDAIASVLALTIADATGDQLAQYGKLLGVSDPGGGAFEALIRAAAAAIGSSGTGDELRLVLRAIKSDDSYALREWFPASVEVEPLAHAGESAGAVFGVLRRAVAGGVRLVLVEVPGAFSFAFSDTDETTTDGDTGFSDTDGAVGGQLVGAIDGTTT